SDYQDTLVLNELDGFNLQPRLSIPFDGPIDVGTVSSRTVFLVNLGSTVPGRSEGYSRVVGINQVVWDPASSTLHVESDELLAQHTRYALVVPSGVHDAAGEPVRASPGLWDFLTHDQKDPGLEEYRRGLKRAALAAQGLGVQPQEVVALSVFTTQSATAVLEEIRDQIHAAPPLAPAAFTLGRAGERTVFNLGEVPGIHWEQQTGDDPPSFTPVDLDLRQPRIIPGAVGQIAFGKYLSPDYEVHPGEY